MYFLERFQFSGELDQVNCGMAEELAADWQ
jgi:hypothetical protein